MACTPNLVASKVLAKLACNLGKCNNAFACSDLLSPEGSKLFQCGGQQADRRELNNTYLASHQVSKEDELL